MRREMWKLCRAIQGHPGTTGKVLTRCERVLRSLKHQEPDWVPIDLGAVDATNINGIAYQRFKHFLGITGGWNRIDHLILDIVKVEDPVLEWVQVGHKPLLLRVCSMTPGWWSATRTGLLRE